MGTDYHIEHSLTVTMIIDTHDTEPQEQSDRWQWCESDRQSSRTERGKMATHCATECSRLGAGRCTPEYLEKYAKNSGENRRAGADHLV